MAIEVKLESMGATARCIRSAFPWLMMASLSTAAAPPGIESQPQGRTVILHQPLAIAVTASGSEPLAYQWRKDGLPVPDATNDHIVFPDAEFSDAGLYSVVISNAEGTATSVDAALAVNTPFGGDIDFSWAWGGWAYMPVQSIVVQGDGKIIMAGGFFTPGAPGPSGGWIARLTVDGAIDGSFINPISTVGSIRTDGLIQSVQLQADGKVLIGGSFRTVNGVSRTNIARLNANGTLDTSFGSALSGTDGLVQSIAVQSDGKVLIGGYFTSINGVSRNRVGRLNADGTLDTSFGDGFSGADGPVRTVAVQSDGKVLIGGQFSAVNDVNRIGIARLDADGSLDSGFESGVAGPAPLNFAVNAISVQNDGRVLIAGYFQTVNGVSRGNIARLNADGTLDSSFGNELSGTDGVVQSIAVQTNGMVLIGGNFHTVSNVTCNNIARLNADGSLDTNFADGLAGANGPVNAIAVENDGKPLIGGSFQTVHGAPMTYFARLNADGTQEEDFGQRSGGNAAVHALAVQRDSKVLVAGEFTVLNGATRNRIGRLNADGTLDSSFADGVAGADNIVRTVAAQADGKVVIGGNFTTVNGVSRSRIARLNADGTLDSAFGDGLSGADGEVRCLAVQGDGKVLIGGDFVMVNGAMRNRIARLNADGSVDENFGSGLSGANNSVLCLALQSDGKVLIGGRFTMINGVTSYRLVRLNEDGTLDTNFVAALSEVSLSILSLMVQSDGKVLVADNLSAPAPFNEIVRLNVDGSLDTSFGNGLSWARGLIFSIAIQDDGKVLIAGGFTAVNNVNRNRIARLNADGTLDGSFAAELSGPNGDVRVLAIDDDNKVLIGGSFWAVNGVPAAYFARLWGDRVPSTHPRIDSSPQAQRITLEHSAAFSVLAAGTEPLSYQWFKDGIPILGATNESIVFQHVQFSDAGVYSVVVSNAEGTTSADAVLTVAWPEPGEFDVSWTSASLISSGAVFSTVIQPDGKILIGGTFTNIHGVLRGRIARLNADGGLDETFMTGLPGANDRVSSVALQTDGKVLIAGWFTNINGVARGRIARLNVDGTVDDTFGNGLSGANGLVESIVVQSDGKVLIGGTFTTVNDVSRSRVARLNADGSLDADFGTGVVQSGVFCIALQNDGRVLVGSTSRIIRLNPDGSLDNTFAGASGSVLSVAVQNDDKVLIGGFFTSVNGVVRNRIARLNADGTLDATFGDGLSGADSPVRSIALQSDGKVLIGGQFGVVNGVGRSRIARLNADGTLDITFLNGLSGANSTVQSIAVQSDSRVVIGGFFTMVNDILSPYVARLWGDPRARIERLDGPQGGEVTLLLRLPEGTTNRVQYKTNLNDSAWIDLPGDMIGDNGLTNKVDATLNGLPHRFYRVQQVP